jgi:hypothetical protein
MQTATTPIAQTQLFYWNEISFYRCVLAIPWRRARKLRELGVLVPDGFVNSKAVYLSDAASVQRHQAAVAGYLQTQRAAKHNL